MSGGNTILRISLILVLFNGVLLQRPSRQSSGGKVRFEGRSNCTTFFNELGVCIVLHKCRAIFPLPKESKERTDFVRKLQCGCDGLEPKVCCPFTPYLSSSTTTPVPGGGGFFPERPVSVAPVNQFRDSCGFSDAIHARVVGGAEADRGAWPWLVALGYRNPKENEVKYKCAGALISDRHVLTAGHCVAQEKDLSFVRLGVHDLQSDNDGGHPIDISIAEKILHPKYSGTTFENDIAVLHLARPVEFTKEIHPICLPDAPELRSMSFSQSFPYLAGWGKVQFRGATSSVLREVQQKVADPAKCKTAYSKSRHVVIDEKVMCAGYARSKKDACQGYSGGPLMWPKGKTFYLIGVSSIGFKYAEPGSPGIYSRVTYFLDWIKSSMVFSQCELD